MTADVIEDAPVLRGKLLCIEQGRRSVDRISGWVAAHPGVQLLHATSGLDGVRMAQTEQPDLVLLDMQLPGIGGLEVIRRLNGEIAARGLRVTILAGDRNPLDTIRAMSLGAFEYWPTTLAPRLFHAGLQRALSGRRADPARTLQRPR